MVPAVRATLPQPAVPELLDPQGEPNLSQPQAADTQNDADGQVGEAGVKPSGDLATMVAELRGPEAATHELECPPTGRAVVSSSIEPSGSVGVIRRSSGSRMRIRSSKSLGRLGVARGLAAAPASDRIWPLMSVPVSGSRAFRTAWAAFWWRRCFGWAAVER